MPQNTPSPTARSTQPAQLPSPCISVCQMDEQTGWCLGCYRTLNEIARWGQSSAADQKTVLQQLPQRHKIAAFEQAQFNPAVMPTFPVVQP